MVAPRFVAMTMLATVNMTMEIATVEMVVFMLFFVAEQTVMSMLIMVGIGSESVD